MSNILLSILIPTVVGREHNLKKLLARFVVGDLDELCKNDVGKITITTQFIEVIISKDNKEITIGEKREKLYQMAKGLYSVQWDDDDDIADDGIERILGVIKTAANSPDCITFQEAVDIDGVKYCSNFSLSYGDWEGDGSKLLSDGFHFHRTPFFKTVIKTEIAKSVPIVHCRFGEDHLFAQALKPHLKTEVHIPRNIYFYNHVSSNPTERYGLDK